ncbi:P2Y purinoceptor 1-like isoform X2 [Perca fluviatilis]|uniref:P2Y purinoceptor 1-like isoform X2 n=1 Tax=Perca fluviatilis TaxID=8168 RepID=UPI0019649661|nr:P2Y purinoceptor 1-like isoform X2 [Perca fluviatilis]
MTNASCQSIIFDFTGRFLPPVYILVFIIGLVANGWGLKSLLHNWKKLKIINVFVLNLGLADILYLLTLPFLVAYYFMESKWIFGDAFCKITRFCFNLNLYGSIGFLTCISVYRYLAIVHPVRLIGRLTLTHSVRISVMVWFLVSVQSLPDMFYSKTFGNNTEKCFDTTSNIYVDDYLKYSLGWTVNGFCIPLLITLGCYGHVIVVLCSTNTTDKISRGLVCLNSALNPLVYLHGNEDIPAQLRQLLQQVRQMFSRPPPTNSAGVPMAQITDGARVKLCKLRAPQDWKEREERKTRGKTWGWRCVCVCVCLEVEMGSREEECETFLMPVQRLFTR